MRCLVTGSAGLVGSHLDPGSVVRGVDPASARTKLRDGLAAQVEDQRERARAPA